MPAKEMIKRSTRKKNKLELKKVLIQTYLKITKLLETHYRKSLETISSIKIWQKQRRDSTVSLNLLLQQALAINQVILTKRIRIVI